MHFEKTFDRKCAVDIFFHLGISDFGGEIARARFLHGGKRSKGGSGTARKHAMGWTLPSVPPRALGRKETFS